MPISNIDARRAQAFHTRLQGVQPPQDHGRCQRFGPAPLRMSNGARQVLALLRGLQITHAIGAGLPRQEPRPYPQPTRPALLAGADAAAPGDAHEPLVPPAAEFGGSLHSAANLALGTCVSRPEHCSKAIVVFAAGAAGAAATALTGVTGFALGRATAPACNAPSVLDQPTRDETATAFLQQLPPPLQADVLDVVHRCRGNSECALPPLRQLLSHLPPDTQRALSHLLGEHPAATDTSIASSGWPPGAAAQALPLDWIEHAAVLLARLHDTEADELQLTLDVISQATLDAQRSVYEGHSPRHFDPADERRVNQARMDAIRARFRQQGLALEAQDFTLNAVNDMGERGLHHGRNLWLEIVGDAPVHRTLLLMAHGDTGGVALRSSGTWANGSGVAALLAIARRFAEQGVPAGTRVQLLVSDLGSEGWIGAKAFVQRCQAERNCPDLTVNLDRLGWGDALAISGTDCHVLVNQALEHPGQRDPRPVAALEARLVEHLHDAAAADRLPVADVPGWSLESDHIPLQREGLAAVGLTQGTAQEMAHSARFLHAREAMNAAADAVQWEHYEAWRAGELETALEQTVGRQLSRWLDARAAFAAEGLPRAQRIADSALDQPGPAAVNPQAAMRIANVAHAAVLALLREEAA